MRTETLSLVSDVDWTSLDFMRGIHHPTAHPVTDFLAGVSHYPSSPCCVFQNISLNTSALTPGILAVAHSALNTAAMASTSSITILENIPELTRSPPLSVMKLASKRKCYACLSTFLGANSASLPLTAQMLQPAKLRIFTLRTTTLLLSNILQATAKPSPHSWKIPLKTFCPSVSCKFLSTLSDLASTPRWWRFATDNVLVPVSTTCL